MTKDDVMRAGCRAPLRRLAMAALFVLGPQVAAAETVTVFAAASLKTAMDGIAPLFEEATGHELSVSLAGSSVLARQIQQGAPADVYLSANTEWMDVLEEDGLLAEGSRVDLLSNTLVLVAPAPAEPVEIGPDADLAGMLGEGRLAMAMVASVPAGIYGKAALESLGLWDDVAPQVAQADNVRAALALVALGEAPLGVVYGTDAHAEPRVGVVGTFPEDSHAPITYPVARIAGQEGAGIDAFLQFLQGPEAAEVFEGQGFVRLGG
ncbi:molybdate ABC transporter substrate-binding protein [Allosediminivita pacifica]|uniref:Molybdate transport system substrate-binding protein n=1 Tax=Allosediminivita pacifica TaxID=1267769 RepID=A0A2T6AZM5_9RHOB|nr:molybdate transport system substrate-binding protein [Allosediminivita pacifica]